MKSRYGMATGTVILVAAGAELPVRAARGPVRRTNTRPLRLHDPEVTPAATSSEACRAGQAQPPQRPRYQARTLSPKKTTVIPPAPRKVPSGRAYFMSRPRSATAPINRGVDWSQDGAISLYVYVFHKVSVGLDSAIDGGEAAWRGLLWCFLWPAQ